MGVLKFVIYEFVIYVHTELFIFEEHGISYICIARRPSGVTQNRQVGKPFEIFFLNGTVLVESYHTLCHIFLAQALG